MRPPPTLATRPAFPGKSYAESRGPRQGSHGPGRDSPRLTLTDDAWESWTVPGKYGVTEGRRESTGPLSCVRCRGGRGEVLVKNPHENLSFE